MCGLSKQFIVHGVREKQQLKIHFNSTLLNFDEMATKLDAKSRARLSSFSDIEYLLQWYKKLPNKRDSAFICFDVVEFYPSISEYRFLLIDTD